jgi:hypothetical protein
MSRGDASRFHDRRITAYVVELFEVVTGGHTRQYPPAYPLLEPISFLPFPRDGLDVLFEACGVPLPMAIGPMAELGMSAPGDDRRHPCPCPSSPSAPAPNDWVTECGYDPLGKRTQAAHLGDRLAGFLPNAPNRLGTVSNPALAAGPPIDPPIAAYKHLGPGRLAQQDTPTIPGSPTTTTTSVGSPNPPTSATPTDSLTAAFASVPANR